MMKAETTATFRTLLLKRSPNPFFSKARPNLLLNLIDIKKGKEKKEQLIRKKERMKREIILKKKKSNKKKKWVIMDNIN